MTYRREDIFLITNTETAKVMISPVIHRILYFIAATVRSGIGRTHWSSQSCGRHKEDKRDCEDEKESKEKKHREDQKAIRDVEDLEAEEDLDVGVSRGCERGKGVPSDNVLTFKIIFWRVISWKQYF